MYFEYVHLYPDSSPSPHSSHQLPLHAPIFPTSMLEYCLAGVHPGPVHAVTNSGDHMCIICVSYMYHTCIIRVSALF